MRKQEIYTGCGSPGWDTEIFRIPVALSYLVTGTELLDLLEGVDDFSGSWLHFEKNINRIPIAKIRHIAFPTKFIAPSSLRCHITLPVSTPRFAQQPRSQSH